MDCISFTSTLMALYDGDINFDQLMADDTEFHFGCLREHLMCESAPVEASWRNTELPKVLDPRRISIEELDPDKRIVWMRFVSILLNAEFQGRITWGICRDTFVGGYYDYAKKLMAAGKDVYPKKYISHLDTKTGEWVQD